MCQYTRAQSEKTKTALRGRADFGSVLPPDLRAAVNSGTFRHSRSSVMSLNQALGKVYTVSDCLPMHEILKIFNKQQDTESDQSAWALRGNLGLNHRRQERSLERDRGHAEGKQLIWDPFGSI